MTLTFRKRLHAVKLPHYQIAAIKPLGTHQEIEAFLRSSGVWPQAKHRLEEIYYYVQDDHGRRKDFFAAGWLNEFGHWQVAAPKFTGPLCRPALTIIPGTDNEAWLFDTVFDYLRHPKLTTTKAYIIILNTPKLLQAALSKAKSFASSRTFFNNPLPET
nr:hypothetical protein [Mucilaginibacter sp. L294]